MASVKDSNTSKTAHVMSLISRNRSVSPPSAAESSMVTVAPENNAAGQQTLPIVTSLESDTAISSAIKGALEESFLQELDSAVPEPPANIPVEEAAPPAGGFAALADGEPQADPPVLSTPPAKKEAPPPLTDSLVSQEPVYGASCENIMRHLVAEQVEKYMELFGLCRCERCKHDVTALALNHLPPKYAVMPKQELFPRLNVYAGRYGASVTAQILRACKTVHEHPRHDISK